MFVVLVDKDKEPSLLIYNAVKLTPRVEKQLKGLGYPVKYLVVPNNEHTLFIKDYFDKFPSIICLCADDEVVEKKLENPNAYKIFLLSTNGGKITPEIQYKIIPGLPYGSEVLLYHKPSSVLLTCDTAMHFTDDTLPVTDSGWTYLSAKYAKWNGFYNNFGIPTGFKYFMKSPRSVGFGLFRACQDWDVKGIGMAHGNPLRPGEMPNVKDIWKKKWMKLCGVTPSMEERWTDK